MHAHVQGMHPTSWEGLKRLRYLKELNPRSCLSWRINKNPKGCWIVERFLRRKRAKQINQPWWSCCLRSCCLSCYPYRINQWISQRLITTWCCTPLIRYWDCRRSHDCFDSKKHNHPNKEIINLHNICW